MQAIPEVTKYVCPMSNYLAKITRFGKHLLPNTRLVLVDIDYANTQSLISVRGQPKLRLNKAAKLKPASL